MTCESPEESKPLYDSQEEKVRGARWRQVQKRFTVCAGLRRQAVLRRCANHDTEIAKSLEEMRKIHWEQLVERSYDNSGILVDFLHRISAKVRPPQEKQKHCAMDVKAVLLAPHQTTWKGVVYATMRIGQELLYSNMMDVITTWRKAGLAQSWRPCENVFKNAALQIIRYRTEAKCLCVEVDSWLFRHKILHCHPHDSETAKERHDRKQQVWSEFHEGNRKVEARAMKPPFKDDLRERLHQHTSPQIKPKPHIDRFEANQKNKAARPKSAALLRSSPNSKAPPGCISSPHVRRKGDCLVHDFEWKRHASRSRVSAGFWDWGHGSTSLHRPSTAPHRKKAEHWSNSLIDAPEEEFRRYAEFAEDEDERISEGLQETFLTGRARMKFPAGGSSLRFDVITRSSSLPNVKMPERQHLQHSKDREPLGRKALNPGLPCVSNAFIAPWQNRTPEPVLKCKDSPTKQYLRACTQAKNIPRLMPYLTGHSSKLKAGGHVLSDDDLLDITVVLDEIPLTEVDLDGNTRLTEKSLLPFITALMQPPNSESLQSLCMKRCINASKASTLNAIIELVGAQAGSPHLRHLDLSDVVMGVSYHALFADAVQSQFSLQSLHLCNTGLGIADQEAQSMIRGVIGCHSLQVLDIGWNSFSAGVLSYIGECHIEMQKLRRLGLSNCTSTPMPGHATNIVYFLEHLSRDQSLRSLDISLNHIDFRGALVLEDALTSCKRLSELNIADNPLGVIGLRSLLRLLCRDSSGLTHFDCSGCSSGVTKNEGEGLQVFKSSTPGGRYRLELERPYHRALLRMLYKTCDGFGFNVAETFSDIRYSLGQWDHACKDALGIWTVPKRGNLSITFRIDDGIRNLMRDVSEIDFEGYLRRYYSLTRHRPSFRKVVPLLAQWKSFDGCTADQQVMLDAMAKDFLFTFPHLSQLCESEGLVGDIIQKLFSCLEGGHPAQFLVLSLCKKELTTFVQSLKQVHCLLSFNAMSPNGHYKLNLAHHAEHALAEQLLLLDRWESNLSYKKGLKDVSQRGNHSVIRNESYRHVPIKARAMVEWHLPEYEILEFDYSSRRRLLANTLPMDDTTHSNIMIKLQESGCNPRDQIVALRLVAHCMFMTSKQLRAVFSLYKDEELFVELIVIFCLVIVDMHNEKIFRVRVEKQSLSQELSRRLGFISAFPFIQPEQTHFVFDFAEWDQRLAANILLNLATVEDRINLRNPSFIDNGRVDPFISGIPRTWDTFENMKRSGVLTLDYQCAPENRNFAARRRLYEQYTHRSLALNESDVLWWSSLADAPPDVLSYLDFLSSKFTDMNKAFETLLHGADIDKSFVSLRDFEEVSLRLGCKKFQGPEEKHRLTMVFRFMDASGEGQVSKDEFMVLDQMFKEILLSISEFVEFCIRTFGGDLHEAWNYLDDDGSGEIEQSEWNESCANLGYCGPVGPIFKYLDKDDEGTVSFDEFAELEHFKKVSEHLYSSTME